MKITFKIWILIICVILSLVSIFSIPPLILEKGVLVSSVKQNTTIFENGLRESMIIQEINGKTIDSMEDYSIALKPFTNLGPNETLKLILKTKNLEIINLFNKNLIDDISVEEIPSTKIKTGLDLRGGARAFIKADVPLNEVQLNDLIAVSEQRLNVYGLSDVKFFKVKTSSGGWAVSRSRASGSACSSAGCSAAAASRPRSRSSRAAIWSSPRSRPPASTPGSGAARTGNRRRSATGAGASSTASA